MSTRHFYYPPLLENEYYHIYNRGNNGDDLFYQPRNYLYFLKLYDTYLSSYLETYAFCLLPNHFHLLVRIRDFRTLPEARRRLQHGRTIIDEPGELISEQFRRFFLSYAKAIKKQEDRTGSLFEKNFRRKRVQAERYFTNLITYIHRNPQLHGVWPDYRVYPYSSFERILIPRETALRKREVLDWFGGQEAYRQFHQRGYHVPTISSLLIED